MRLNSNIFTSDNYHVHRGFHKQLPGLYSYLVKTLGIDCDDQKKCAEGCANDGSMPKEISSVCRNMFKPKKVKKAKNKLKQEEECYEEVEEAI